MSCYDYDFLVLLGEACSNFAMENDYQLSVRTMDLGNIPGLSGSGLNKGDVSGGWTMVSLPPTSSSSQGILGFAATLAGIPKDGARAVSLCLPRGRLALRRDERRGAQLRRPDLDRHGVSTRRAPRRGEPLQVGAGTLRKPQGAGAGAQERHAAQLSNAMLKAVFTSVSRPGSLGIP